MTEKKSLEVLIIGAGSVGQVYGYHLNKGGANVHFYVREHNREKLTKFPMRLHKLSSVIRVINKSTTENWSNYTVHTDTEVDNGNDTLPNIIDYVVFTLPTDKFNTGDWLEKLLNLIKKRPGKVMYVSPIPDEACMSRLISLGIKKEQLISAQINMCSYFAPLNNQCVEARGTEVAKEEDKSDNLNKVVVYGQLTKELFGNVTKEAKEETEQFVQTMNNGGFESSVWNGDLRYGVYCIIIMPILVALAISKWNMMALATNYALLSLVNASMKEDAKIQKLKYSDMKSLNMFDYIPTIVMSISIMIFSLLSKYVCTFDIEAFFKAHFGDKLYTQTEYWIECLKRDSKEWKIQIDNMEKLFDEYEKTVKKRE